MPTLYISELNAQGLDNGKHIVPLAQLPALVDQAVAISSSSAQSAAFGTSTTMVRVYTDTACWILAGTDPTATTAKTPLAAGAAEYFGVTPGHKIAAITA